MVLFASTVKQASNLKRIKRKLISHVCSDRSSNSNQFKLKHRVRVCEMWTANCLDDVSEATRAVDKSFVIGWPTTNTVATFSTSDMKELWFTKLQE